jgi:hypothetical protein
MHLPVSTPAVAPTPALGMVLTALMVAAAVGFLLLLVIPTVFASSAFSSSGRPLTEWNTCYPAATIRLTECDWPAFSMRDAHFALTTSVAESKGITVAWQCSRTLLGSKTTTEDMAQGLINAPL